MLRTAFLLCFALGCVGLTPPAATAKESVVLS